MHFQSLKSIFWEKFLLHHPENDFLLKNMKLYEQHLLKAYFYSTQISASLFSKNEPKFCRLATTPVYKISRFPLNMLIFMQKCIRFSGSIVKKILMDLHYWTSWLFGDLLLLTDVTIHVILQFGVHCTSNCNITLQQMI